MTFNEFMNLGGGTMGVMVCLATIIGEGVLIWHTLKFLNWILKTLFTSKPMPTALLKRVQRLEDRTADNEKRFIDLSGLIGTHYDIANGVENGFHANVDKLSGDAEAAFQVSRTHYQQITKLRGQVSDLLGKVKALEDVRTHPGSKLVDVAPLGPITSVLRAGGDAHISGTSG